MSRVLIVGGGPVGLFLACLLALDGHEVLVLERRESASRSARSIGVHPPALEALDSIGLAGPFVECGVAIRRAHIYDEMRYLGALSLGGCPPPFPFVLTLPQGVTERLLEERLEQVAPGALRRGVEVEAVRTDNRSVEVLLDSGELVSGDFLVGCDGHRSRVRDALAASVRGGSSSCHYLMADIEDTSGLGSDAAFYLGRAGVVESFPLPGSRRRWVARLSERTATTEFEQLRSMVTRRTGHELPSCRDELATTFTAENRLAVPLAGPRWALVGDAAHVVSPIGGQGMNLGLMGARALVERGFGSDWTADGYDREQRRRARRATKRAGVNMALGGTRVPSFARWIALEAVLHPWISDKAARFFTMRGL